MIEFQSLHSLVPDSVHMINNFTDKGSLISNNSPFLLRALLFIVELINKLERLKPGSQISKVYGDSY